MSHWYSIIRLKCSFNVSVQLHVCMRERVNTEWSVYMCSHGRTELRRVGFTSSGGNQTKRKMVCLKKKCDAHYNRNVQISICVWVCVAPECVCTVCMLWHERVCLLWSSLEKVSSNVRLHEIAEDFFFLRCYLMYFILKSWIIICRL